MNWKSWVYGLLSSVISAFSTAASGAIVLPTVFSFDQNGLINMLKMAAVPAILAFFLYLKTHPLPDSTITVTTTQTVAKTGAAAAADLPNTPEPPAKE